MANGDLPHKIVIGFRPPQSQAMNVNVVFYTNRVPETRDHVPRNGGENLVRRGPGVSATGVIEPFPYLSVI